MLAVGVASAQQKIDLSGQWRIKLDPTDVGIKEKWFGGTFGDQLRLPESLQEQGFGNDIDINTQWTGKIADRSWYDAPEYAKYREKENIKVPFWLNPDKHYVGVAWYQRDIEIPKNWKGKTVEISFERTHWETAVYIDSILLGSRNSISTPHRYEVKELQPGEHTITVRVDNRVHIPVGENAHSVSDHTQSNWNGLIGDLAISAKPRFYIDDVQVYPDAGSQQVKTAVTLIGTPSKTKGRLSMQLYNQKGNMVGEPVDIKFDGKQDTLRLDTTIRVAGDIALWSEHTPNLYRLKTVVLSGKDRDEKYTQFGFRDFKKSGTRFHVNGQPIFLRGTLECCIFPLTGYPAMDRQYWEKIYGTCREFGLNHVRFHSWCPPEVAFSVADSMGIYLQVECAVWTEVGNGRYIDKWLYEESDRILKEYGNHPSFCMLAHGNEPAGNNQGAYLSKLVDYWKNKDDRRAYTSSAAWPYIPNADYWNATRVRIQAWGEGLNSIINAQPPRTDFNFAHLMKQDMPTVSHEVGQWCVYPNFKEIAKYTGVLKAKNLEIFQETLEANHMGDLADDFLYASGKLQTLCYKADIEAALRTPGFAGFQLLDLHDFPGQGSALVGVLDAFWDTKGYVDGKGYSMFCNQTVPLIRFPKMVYLNTEKLNAPLEFAHFGKEPLKDARIVWRATTSDNRVVGQGSFVKDLPLDNCIQIGNIEMSFEQFTEPTQLTVSAEIENTPFKNQWNIWVYQATKKSVVNMPYITSTLDDVALQRLNDGENVLLISPKGNVRPEKGGKIEVGFSSIFWNTAWTNNSPPQTLGVLCDKAHPALAVFPNDGYSDYQWWDIVSNCDAMILDDFPADFRPVVHLIDDWFKNRRLGILFEAKVGNGKLMVCSVDLLDNLDKRPAAAQFKQSILEYMGSDKFNPAYKLSPALIHGLFKR